MSGELMFRRYPMRQVNVLTCDIDASIHTVVYVCSINARRTSVYPCPWLTLDTPGRGELLTNYFSQNSTSAVADLDLSLSLIVDVVHAAGAPYQVILSFHLVNCRLTVM